MLKQRSAEKDWEELLEKCDKIVSPERLAELEHKAVSDIRKIARSCKCAYGYSGGKDSVVLNELVKIANVNILCFSSILEHEYPEMERFIRRTAPNDVVYLQCDGYPIEFLNSHPEYLFPEVTNKKVRGEYTSHWRTLPQKYLRMSGYDAMITGRRIEDGNYCGKREDDIYTSRNKLVTSYNVIADWTHAELLAYIKVNALPLAPIYRYPNGFPFGTHAWTERDRVDGSIDKTFDEVWAIDKSIVIRAAKEGLIAAQKYLANRRD